MLWPLRLRALSSFCAVPLVCLSFCFSPSFSLNDFGGCGNTGEDGVLTGYDGVEELLGLVEVLSLRRFCKAGYCLCFLQPNICIVMIFHGSQG